MSTLNEVKLLQSMKHQHIIIVYHSFIEESYFYILMEYAAGGDLEQLSQNMYKQKEKFSQKQLWKWSYEILLALNYLHDSCIIHCDIKAPNIFLTKKKRIKIGDFGCSRVLNPAKMYIKDEVGTTVFLSPEQVNRVGLYDYKIDIWATGCCLYYLATFKPPFNGSAGLPQFVSAAACYERQSFANLSYSILNEEPDELCSDYSDDFKDMIKK